MIINNLNLRNVLSIALIMLAALASSAGRTQDIELFSGTNPASTAKPNVLIILDNTANWNQTVGGTTAWDPELLALSNTIQGLVANGFGNKIRVGLMMFTGSAADGGYVRFAIRDMNATNAAQFSNLARTIRAENQGAGNPEQANNAAYAQGMNEAYLYFFGKLARAGFADDRRDCGSTNLNNLKASPAPGYNLTTLSNYGYSSCGSAAWNNSQFSKAGNNSGVTYTAPPEVSLACQRNFIVFISNGPISSNDNGPGLTLLRAAIAAEGAGSTTVIPVTPNGETASSYADEWARFLNEVKNVQTYTINANDKSTGQALNHEALMRSMAISGGGDFCKATDPASIQECLNAAFTKILAVNSVFASATLPVSVNPQLQNLDQVYMGMFRPDSEGNPRWFGNLKQYKLAINISGNPYLADSAGNQAIDPITGRPFSTITSYWTSASNYWAFSPSGSPSLSSDAPDGELVEKGGAAERLRAIYASTASTVANRKVFTCIGCTSQTALIGGTDTSTGSTSFSSANATTLAPGLRVTAANAPGLIKWVRGENTDGEKTDGGVTEVRPSIHGDVLHSSPKILTISDTNIYLFYGANDGMIHAIRGGRATNGGDEVWSFLPEEFLPRLNRQRTNIPVTWSFDTISTTVTLTSGSNVATVGSKTGLTLGMYLEGTSNIPKSTYISAIDPTLNQVTLSQAALGAFNSAARFVPEAKPMFADGPLTVYSDPTNNKTYLFAAMRRGGRFLYAFDITDPANPLYLWRKGCAHAGITTNNGYACDTGYDELGQSWSELKVARVGTSGAGANQTVLIFGAGYDPTVDDPDPALTSGRTMGRGVFVVDAYTGTVLRQFGSADNANLAFAVPADITLIDFDRDGFFDRLYFGDTGGQIWRIDTNSNKDPSGTNWTLQRMASLGLGAGSGQSGAANGRKFLFAPDVVETAPGSGVYAILVSSGDRENPLNGATGRSTATVVTNRVYMLLDGAPRGTTLITESNLDDRTSTATSVVGNLGWYVTFTKSGEKGTGSIITLAGSAYFGTNYPVQPAAGSCFSTVGNARFYTLDFLTAGGRSGNPSTPSSDITVDRFSEIVGGGMPPSPVGTIIATGNNKFMEAVIMGTKASPVGPAKVGDRFRNYWYKLFDKK